MFGFLARRFACSATNIPLLIWRVANPTKSFFDTIRRVIRILAKAGLADTARFVGTNELAGFFRWAHVEHDAMVVEPTHFFTHGTLFPMLVGTAVGDRTLLARDAFPCLLVHSEAFVALASCCTIHCARVLVLVKRVLAGIFASSSTFLPCRIGGTFWPRTLFFFDTLAAILVANKAVVTVAAFFAYLNARRRIRVRVATSSFTR